MSLQHVKYWIAFIWALKLIVARNLICTYYALVSNVINIIQYTWQYQYSKIKFYSDSVKMFVRIDHFLHYTLKMERNVVFYRNLFDIDMPRKVWISFQFEFFIFVIILIVSHFPWKFTSKPTKNRNELLLSPTKSNVSIRYFMFHLKDAYYTIRYYYTNIVYKNDLWYYFWLVFKMNSWMFQSFQ